MKSGDHSHLRQHSNYGVQRFTSGGPGSATLHQSSAGTQSKQCEPVVEDFEIEDRIKHVTIRDTAEVLEFHRDEDEFK